MKLIVALGALVFLISCSATRVDRVISDVYEPLPCSDSFICDIDERIKILERSRVVTGGVALNTTGTRNQDCTRKDGLYLCVTRQYVYETHLVGESTSSELFNTVLDGYASSSATVAPSSCEIFTTKKIADAKFRPVAQYYNFSLVNPESISVVDRTGSALEDHTIATLRCDRDCTYDIKTDRWSNDIQLLLSETRTSGRLATQQKRARELAIKKFLANCEPEVT